MFKLAANGLPLCEGGVIEVQMFKLALKPTFSKPLLAAVYFICCLVYFSSDG